MNTFPGVTSISLLLSVFSVSDPFIPEKQNPGLKAGCDVIVNLLKGSLC